MEIYKTETAQEVIDRKSKKTVLKVFLLIAIGILLSLDVLLKGYNENIWRFLSALGLVIVGMFVLMKLEDN